MRRAQALIQNPSSLQTHGFWIPPSKNRRQPGLRCTPTRPSRKGALIVPRSALYPALDARVRASRDPLSSSDAPLPSRRGSWTLPAPEGAYGPLPAWHSGAAWFDALLDALATTAGEKRRRHAKVARDTLLRVARADWLAADAATGRNLATAHGTVAGQLGMSAKTVQRARGLMEALGFAATVSPGRYLTEAERTAAAAAHGGRQIRAASTRALTMPAPVENVHLPRRGDLPRSSSSHRYSPTRDHARNATASRPRAQTKKKTRDGSGGPVASTMPRPLSMQRLGAQLVARMPWLGRGRHIGQLLRMLDRVGIEPDQWTAAALMEVIEQGNRAAGLRVVDPGAQRDPIAYLGWLIRRAIDPAEATPRQLADDARTERETRRAEYAAAHAADEQIRRTSLTAEGKAAREAFFAERSPRGTGRRRPHRPIG